MGNLCSWILVCTCVHAAAIAIGEQAASNHLDFAGVWQLNQELSDAVPLLPGEAMAQARASGAIRTPADLRRDRRWHALLFRALLLRRAAR